MITGFTKNKSVQILIALLKAHGIKKVILSPGTTILEFSAGLQYDGSFELYSAVDERSAAYMACGMACECGEPVVIACTEAPASRDYYPGLSEAYYRKLPILAVTGVHRYSEIGHLHSQIIDRSQSPKDTFKLKVHLPVIKDKEDEWQTELLTNQAILELNRQGGGPVHIDLPCCNNDYDFSTTQLPSPRVIKRFYLGESMPKLPEAVNSRIAIYSGFCENFSAEETRAVDKFCSQYDAVVFCDHVSGYRGKYAVNANRIAIQNYPFDIFENVDVLIHIGEQAADEATAGRLAGAKEVWRVSPDGELRDTFKKLKYVFEMNFVDFIKSYIVEKTEVKNGYLESCKKCISGIKIEDSEVPFSNIYMASRISENLPEDSSIHLGVSNTIRSWSMFDFPESVLSYSNTGCRGIDGILSAFVGASIANRDRLFYCVLGDLSFFYDMNALGNREIGNNVRILLINNNGGGIFKLAAAPGYRFFGDVDTNRYIAASGHFGDGSRNLVKHYAEDLGFTYLSAENKEEFDKHMKSFLSADIGDSPMLLEAFTRDVDEREAFQVATSIIEPKNAGAKKIAKQILGESGTKFVKKMLKGN